MWVYEDSTWAWIQGGYCENVPQGGSYGSKGVYTPGNIPACRLSSQVWTTSDGFMWLFGGFSDNPHGILFCQIFLNFQLFIILILFPSWHWYTKVLYLRICGHKLILFLAINNFNDLWRMKIVGEEVQWIWMSGSNASNALSVYQGN